MAVETREWTTRDRSEWGSGAWDGEPDKRQWTDEATGLDCLIVRGPLGALCGYVGVPEGHPWHGKDYNDADCDVHGGLTFADFCHEPTREGWEKARGRRASWEAEALRYPQGDAARRLREYAALLDDFDAYCEHQRATSICHVGAEGKTWWLGFDCAHSGDSVPGMNRRGMYESDAWYKDMAYVKGEVESLARQIKAAA